MDEKTNQVKMQVFAMSDSGSEKGDDSDDEVEEKNHHEILKFVF